MNIISWNCKGLVNSSKVEVVNDLIRMDSLDILLLQETKIDEDNLLSISNKKWNLNVGKAVTARGTAGGIATLWTEKYFSLEHSHSTWHWMLTELHHSQSMNLTSLFNIYVLVNFQE